MRDLKISNIKINARWEVSFKVLMKNEDFSIAELELLKNAEINWDNLDFEITWLITWNIEKQRKEKIQKLVFLMQTYCEKSNSDMEQEKQKLYTRNKVKSRSELNWSQLDYEIDLYKRGLMEYN